MDLPKFRSQTRLASICAAVLALPAVGTLIVATPQPACAQAAKDPKTDRLWRAKCASCHGEDGKGQTDQGKKMGTADMTTAAWQKSLTDDQMNKGIADGLKRDKDGKHQEMDAFKEKLKPEQIAALVVYVRALGK
jgi:mono/diheme cytochrome c family protein